MHERQKLMAMLRKYDFVLYELQLYLDTQLSPRPAQMAGGLGAAAENGVRLYPAVRPDPTQTNRRKCSVGLD